MIGSVHRRGTVFLRLVSVLRHLNFLFLQGREAQRKEKGRGALLLIQIWASIRGALAGDNSWIGLLRKWAIRLPGFVD